MKFINIIKTVALLLSPVLLFLFYDQDTLSQLAFFGAIGGFLGGDEIQDSINEQQRYVMDPWNKAWDDLFGEGGMQEQTFEDYQRQYQEMLDFFESGSQQAQEELRLSQAQEMGYLDTGREESMQMLGQQFDQARGSTQAQNIMQGLSNTSWGQQSMGAIGEQQGLAEAGVATDYAQRYAATTARQGQEMANFDQWRIGAGTAMQGKFAEGLAGLRGNWAARRQSNEQFGASLRGGWAERNIAHTERNVGVGLDFASSLLGSFGF
tara:strand:+ start:4215 stop:5009 length:795 start_codon:yes stop_codon:yes gene_type:complete